MKLSSVGVAILLLLSGVSDSSASPRAREQLQAIPIDASVPDPPIPIVAEGKRHWLYELHLTNFGRGDLSLARVAVTDGMTGQMLLTLSGDSLSSVIARRGVIAKGSGMIIGPGQRTVLFLDVILPASARRPTEIRHRLTFDPVRTIDLRDETVLDLDPIRVSSAVPISLGPPLRGGCWVASHALSNDSAHRRTLIALNGRASLAQRYAIDWIRIGEDGQAFRGDPADNRNWSAYGAEVLAVADGTVLEARDGIPENDPTSDKKAVPINLETVGGNHVLISLPGGGSVFYAHMQPGSIRVHEGERIHRGDVIGRIGNSGQADAPHLHIHVTDGRSTLAAEGVPMQFQSFELQGHLPSLAVLANRQGWRPQGPAQVRRNEMPLENAVVRFPGGTSPCVKAR